MKTAEFLNTKANYMLQVLPEHAGDDPESGLVSVPKGAEKATLCNGFLIFWKGSKYSFSIKEGNKWCYKLDDDSVYFDFNEYMRTYGDSKIIWQRNTLQQKVDEVRQHLGITNNNTLSVMIGREKSYLRKLLKRKASSATIDKVIAELDALIDSQSEKIANAENRKTIGELREDAIWIYINELENKIKQANEIAEMWEDSYKRSFKLNAWLFLIIILFIGLFIAWWAL